MICCTSGSDTDQSWNIRETHEIVMRSKAQLSMQAKLARKHAKSKYMRAVEARGDKLC